MVAAFQSAIATSSPLYRQELRKKDGRRRELASSRLRSRMNVGGEAEVQTDRLHDPEDGALGVDIGRGEHAGVLLDDRSRAGFGPGVEKSAYRSPRIVAVLLKERCGVDADQR